MLQEAIAQLSAAANVFDGQAAKANEGPVVPAGPVANVVAAPVAQAGQVAKGTGSSIGYGTADAFWMGFIAFIACI